jgi:hypothetical protein
VYQDYENVPPIVSEEIWEQANKILEARANKHSNPDKSIYNQRFPLSSKLYCAHDNCCYTRGNWKTKDGKKIYWGCTCYRNKGVQKSDGCRSPLLYEEELVKAFKPIVKEIIDNCDDIIDEIKELLRDSSKSSDYDSQIEKLNKELSNIENQKNNLFNMRTNNEISAIEFAEFKEKLNVKYETIKKAQDKVITLKNNSSTSYSTADELRKTIKQIIDVNDDSVLSIASSLFEKIIVENCRDKEDNKKAVLHCQLRLKDSERHYLSLSQLSLLPRSDARICSP